MRDLQSDQNMMKPQMRNSYEFRLVQVSSYSGQTVESEKTWLDKCLTSS